MDLDQHTRHVTEALDKRLRDNWKPRRFSDQAQRQLAAADLVSEIRTATEQLLADCVADLVVELTETQAVVQELRNDLAIAQATAKQEAKTVTEREFTIKALKDELAGLHRTMAKPARKDPLTEAVEANARILTAKRPEWSEAAREPASGTPAPAATPQTAAKRPRTARTGTAAGKAQSGKGPATKAGKIDSGGAA